MSARGRSLRAELTPTRADATPARAPAEGDWPLAFAVVVFLGVVLPLLVVEAGDPAPGHTFTLAVLWAICMFSSLRLAGFVLYRRAQLIRLAFVIFCYAFIGLAAMAQISAGAFPLVSPLLRAARIYDYETVSRTAVLFLVGIVAHEVGYLIRGRSPAPEAQPASPIDTPRHGLATFNVRLVVALSVAGVAVALAAVAASGLSPFFTSREAAGQALLDDVGPADGGSIGLLWSRVTHVVPFAALLVLLHFMRHNRSRRTFGYQVLAALVAGCNVVVNNPIGNSRLWAGVVIFGIISVFVDLRRPRPVLGTTVGMTVAFVLVFPYADAFRRTDGSHFVFGSPLYELRGSGSFSAFQTAANGLRYVDVEGLSWGHQLLAGLFTFIPRTVWISKPPDTGYVVDPIYNRAVPFWTEMHVNFDMAGVVIGLFILGVLARRADDSFILGHRWALLMVPIVAPYYFILLRGTLSAAVGTMLPMVLVLLLPLLVPEGHARSLGVSPRLRQMEAARP